MHELLMELTKSLPVKVIEINDQPYLERYYVKTDLDGTQHWLHRFLRDDSERHLHSHPWSAVSTILRGSYTEEKPQCANLYLVGDKNIINTNTIHRISSVEPNTWTYMVVNPERLPEWFFINDDGEKTAMRTSEPEWWRKYYSREAPIAYYEDTPEGRQIYWKEGDGSEVYLGIHSGETDGVGVIFHPLYGDLR